VSGDNTDRHFKHGRASDVALSDNPELNSWRIYLCGHPDMVAKTKKQVFLAGASFSDIYADPFLISA
jgi:NAD(P)H-flavin reductase